MLRDRRNPCVWLKVCLRKSSIVKQTRVDNAEADSEEVLLQNDSGSEAAAATRDRIDWRASVDWWLRR